MVVYLYLCGRIIYRKDMYLPPFRLTPEILRLVSEIASQAGILRALDEIDDFSMKRDENTSDSASSIPESADGTAFITYILRTLQETVRQEVKQKLQDKIEQEVNNKIEKKVKDKKIEQKPPKVEDKIVKKVENKTSSLRLSSSEQRILSLLANDSHLTIADLSQKTRLSEAGINKILASLRKKDMLERVGANKNGYWIVK